MPVTLLRPSVGTANAVQNSVDNVSCSQVPLGHIGLGRRACAAGVPGRGAPESGADLAQDVGEVAAHHLVVLEVWITQARQVRLPVVGARRISASAAAVSVRPSRSMATASAVSVAPALRRSVAWIGDDGSIMA
jgi:hypothetical protein